MPTPMPTAPASYLPVYPADGILLGPGLDATTVQLTSAIVARTDGSNKYGTLTRFKFNGYQPSAQSARWVATNIFSDKLQAVVLEVYAGGAGRRLATAPGNLYVRQRNAWERGGYGGFVGNTGDEANRVYNTMSNSNLRVQNLQFSSGAGIRPTVRPTHPPQGPPAESMPNNVGQVQRFGHVQAGNTFSGLAEVLPQWLRGDTAVGITTRIGALLLVVFIALFAMRAGQREPVQQGEVQLLSQEEGDGRQENVE